MIFSFILCVGIKAGEGEVNTDVWSFLLTGGAPLAREDVFPNPAPHWIRSVMYIHLIQPPTLEHPRY